ncbi:MAG TPA: helix-turn-helix domain-containing protein [Citreicella sp.]|jgi:excisionase family DNA binding protein|uniref:DNA binding domain-containing protein, excisionase family n=1 Tax=Salipiger marinus TaxID=555512 RepID=A0A1G8UEX2_9RHOB|nr:DNA binding domain-containing protein, excisionase family [Salipiger marinus]HBM58057.1 helix-turn-helix domain-containing protein [Citreicella sp.]HBT01845.1 helix-turn-helix domain-containing protein [Citreicella sp.]|tara:strand:- start:330 stop:614 length:285 start_codon:yes stop_codon:yes gene_type:complete
MAQQRPMTPEMLAQRWQCSAETIRQMVKRGDLRGFRVGRMIRIPFEAVEEHECQKSASDACEAGSASIGATPRQENEPVMVLRHAPERRRQLKD